MDNKKILSENEYNQEVKRLKFASVMLEDRTNKVLLDLREVAIEHAKTLVGALKLRDLDAHFKYEIASVEKAIKRSENKSINTKEMETLLDAAIELRQKIESTLDLENFEQ